MKKRSLFAAVAMLIVSAIVLTSATFAWFQTDGTITTVEFVAKTEANAAGLLLSATGAAGSWKNTMTITDYATVSGSPNVLLGGATETESGSGIYEITAANTLLTPVSGTIGATGVTFKAGELDGTSFESTNDPREGYLKYTTYVKSKAAAGTISITPYFSINSCPFTYLAIAVTKAGSTTMYKYTGVLPVAEEGQPAITSVSYDAIKTNFTATDTNNDAIINQDETNAATNLTTVSGVPKFDPTANPLTVSVDKDQAIEVTVYFWAEGQDPDCAPGAAEYSGQNGYVTFGFTPASGS